MIRLNYVIVLLTGEKPGPLNIDERWYWLKVQITKTFERPEGNCLDPKVRASGLRQARHP